jgi:FixJ family two-component response regulator
MVNQPDTFTLLLVDDDPLTLSGLKRLFHNDGYRLITAGSGPEALALVENVSVNAALIDYQMPGMDGLELLNRLLRKDPQMQVIMLTGQGIIETAVTAMKEGAADFLEKPFRPEALRARIRQLVQIWRLRSENHRLKRRGESPAGFHRLIGRTPTMQAVKQTITRAALSGGAPLAPYLKAFSVDLFLSRDEADVRRALEGETAAALIYDRPDDTSETVGEIRIAFDGDAILFSDESERIFQAHGLEAFARHEAEKAREPLAAGPFARFLHKLSVLQAAARSNGVTPIRTALVTARGGPAHERVIRTLAAWGVVIDEAFFLGGLPKTAVLEAFRPHIFFDDQAVHCDRAASRVPTGRVPGR